METANPDETIEVVGASQDNEMILVIQNRGTSLDLEASRDRDHLLETMNTIHNRDGGANLLHPGANLKQRATKVNPILDLVHLMPKVTAAVAKETKLKQNRLMPRNGSKNLPHRPRRLSLPTFV
jgi:hypothetical protein